MEPAEGSRHQCSTQPWGGLAETGELQGCGFCWRRGREGTPALRSELKMCRVKCPGRARGRKGWASPGAAWLGPQHTASSGPEPRRASRALAPVSPPSREHRSSGAAGSGSWRQEQGVAGAGSWRGRDDAPEAPELIGTGALSHGGSTGAAGVRSRHGSTAVEPPQLGHGQDGAQGTGQW